MKNELFEKDLKGSNPLQNEPKTEDIDGLTYKADYITLEQEKWLIKKIDNEEWLSDL